MAHRRTSVHARWLALLAMVVLAAAGASMTACGSEEDVPDGTEDGGQDGGDATSDDVDATTDDGSPVDDAGADARCLDASPDADVDCTGKCGPVKDPCTGVVKQCGGCSNAVAADGGDGGPRVCDLATSTCVTPKVTCADLGAECGTLKNSCGEYLDCPDTSPKGCAAGKECDPDTHKCRECQQVTCKDLGYECGFAWLGCGEDDPANYTDCGLCAAAADGGARKCNAVFHTCEPSCTPKSDKEICDEAKEKKGLQCGVISNGCGGTVNCDKVPGYGCSAGESCGVRGIANRCDAKQAPDECKALGKNCGEITSACTGQKVKCGDCPGGQVCNANGVCGAPCSPKTCADFAAYECGTFDDSCGGTITCGACPGGICDNATNTCCATNTCAATYAGKCGSKLPNGCGQNALDCACTNPATCTTDGGASPPPPASSPGLCCTPMTAASYAGKCGTNLPDGCGKNNVNVACPNGGVCVDNATGAPGKPPAAGTPGTCCTRTDTCGAPGGDGDVCTPNTQNSCLTVSSPVSCTKCVAGLSCPSGTCCAPAAACTGGECNTTKPANGCGSDRACDCGGTNVCWCTNHECKKGVDGPGTCKAPLTCSSSKYKDKCGTALDDEVGGTIGCGCGTGKVCSTSAPGAVGTCECKNGLGKPYDCTNVPNGPGKPGGDACGVFDNGCGGTLTCNCPAGQACNTAANPNVCCAPATCPTAGIGSACGAVSNGCTTVSCGCPTGAGNENFKCTAGTCTCVKDTCLGRTGPQPDGCGGTLQCGG